MKSKILLTSALAITIACPAMSDPLPAIDDCVQSEIGVSEGTASLEADWSANTINLTWDNNGATTDATGGASTCTYDQSFNLPIAPERTGYNFAGWKVKLGFDLSTLESDICTGGSDIGYTRLNGNTGYSEAYYGLTQGSGEWTTKFSYGTIKGKAVCANNGGTFAKAGTPQGTGGQYCWCQTTGFDAEKDGTYMPVSSSSGVFNRDYGDADACALRCAWDCSNRALNPDFFRAALYGLAAN